MAAAKNGTRQSFIEKKLQEASWLVSHADGLDAFGQKAEARAEWLRAAACEQQVACLLEAEGQDVEAAVHYVSAGSCYAQVQHYSDAVPLVRAALSFSLRTAYRRRVQKLLTELIPKAKAELRRQARKHPAVVS